MRSQHPLSELLLKKLKPLPLPQQLSRIISQIMEPHPHPLLFELAEFPHPHPVAVKSLIFASNRFLIMVYHMYYGLFVFQRNKIFSVEKEKYLYGHLAVIILQ